MANELEQPLFRGVAVTRREEAPPFRVDVDARRHATLHVVVRGSFYLAQDDHRVLPLAEGDVVLLGPGAHPAEPRLHCVAGPAGAPAAPPRDARPPLRHSAQPDSAELISAAYAPVAAPGRGIAAEAPPVHLTAADVRREPGLPVILGLLRAALADRSEGRERLARSLLDPLLAYVLHCHERVVSGDPRGAPRPADGRVARALHAMESSLARRWTVESLARVAGLSRAAFARRFLADVGVPPLRHLADLRMAHAARLLAGGDGSLASVAAEVGYDSEFAFSRAFKRRTGEAPTVFRHRRRAEAAPLRLPPIRAAA